MARLQEGNEAIEESLDDLERAARIPAKQRAVQISSLVERVCGIAYEDGLSNASLSALVDILTLPNALDQGSLGSLVRNLYPAGKVPDDMVIRVVGSLGQGKTKLPYAIQSALLKWLAMVYDVLENPRILAQLYGVLFNLLDTTAIRPQLCHVLSLITRRKHVRPFRIQTLMQLTRQAGNEPPLVGLMRVYKDYYPDVILGTVTSGRASVFTHPNPEWRQRLGEIQEANLQKSNDNSSAEQSAFKLARNASGRRTRSNFMPEVCTSLAHDSSVTLEEIDDVNEFIQKLERIDLPNQLVAVLSDPLLQKFLQLRSSAQYTTRIDNWLLAFFEDQLQSSLTGEAKILEMLEAIRGYTQYTKVLPLACQKYLQSMVHSWNGTTGRKVILDLFAYTPISSFEGLYSSDFQPLEEALLQDGGIDSKVALITFYRDLLEHWTVTLLSDQALAVSNAPPMAALIKHANNLCVTTIQTSQTIPVLSTVLDFYESAASLISEPSLRSIVRITIPPAPLVYTLAFVQSLSVVSRLCGILALYKKAFEFNISSDTSDPSVPKQTYTKEYLNHFNGFLMDICNNIWRSRAFNTSDPNALGCTLPPTITSTLSTYVATLDASLSLQTFFSLSYSPILSLLAIQSVRELEDQCEDEIEVRHPGPVTQLSLKQLERDGGLVLSWPDYRLGVLRWMEQKGLEGLSELMYCTMKNLKSSGQSRA